MENDDFNDCNAPLLPHLVSCNTSTPSPNGDLPEDCISGNMSLKPIIAVVMLERLTYYSILANLFLFFKDDVFLYEHDNSSINSSKSVLVLSGMSWLMCVAGGWISDSKLGKLKTLIFGLIFYLMGTFLLFGLACLLHYYPNKINSSTYRAILVYASLIVALVGEGAYKANISPFGAGQLSRKDPTSLRRFFNYYYCSINIGAFFAFSVVAYFQQWKGFVIGFAIPFVSIFFALVVFLAAKKHYKSLPLQHILGKVCQIVKEGRRNHRNRTRSSLSLQDVTWLDRAKLKNGGSYLDWEVEEVRMLLRIVPVFLVLIPYWSIYSQMQSTFFDQGIHMKLHSRNSFSVPAAWLNLFNIMAVVILIPVMERFIYPWLAKHNCCPSPLTRITVGILIACLSIIAAGFVEVDVRDHIAGSRGKRVLVQTVNERNVTAADVSIFYQIPQYVLIGLSEVFAVVGGLEFAYRNAPKSMQSWVMALYFATHSLGSMLGYGLLELCEACGFLMKNEDGYYNSTYYFYLLCVLMLLSWAAFVAYVNHSAYSETKNSRNRWLQNRFFGDTPRSTTVHNDRPTVL